ncbi:MAG: hypothetical protein F4X02_08140 [Chloroflexi bacterium]|nr:hypothetical protein [Chloroflexota bacterium]
MFGRKRAKQSSELLEYLARTQSDQRKRLVDQASAADEKNAKLEAEQNSLEQLLADALATDSYIDLDTLKKTPRTPAFDGKQPRRDDYLPAALSALQSLLPWKRRAYRDQYQAAEARFDKDRQNFRDAFYEHQAQADREQAQVDAHNAEVETYKQDFDAGEPYAIANYFELILESSAYTVGFPKQTDIEFVAERQALRVEFSLPTPDVIPDASRYVYDATRDEIVAAAMSNKRRRRLYRSMLAQISLRAVHEIFTADRTEKLDRIDFGGYAEGINPSSGQEGRFCLVALAITRRQYESLDLRRVDPLACLAGLGARLSSKPDQMSAVSPVSQAETQGAGDDPQTGQPVNELQGQIHAQADQIADLERKLEAHRDRIAILQPALRDEQARTVELQGEVQKHRDSIASLEKQLKTRSGGTSDLRDEQERNAQLQSELDSQRDAIAEQEKQQNVQFTRHALLATELRDEQARTAELQGEVQRQRDYIAELEDRLDAENAAMAKPDDSAFEDSDDTQPTEAVSDSSADGEFAEAEMFAPIAGETVDEGVGGVPVPPRPGEAPANMHLAPHPKLLQIMSLFVRACKGGQYASYNQSTLYEYQVDRLLQAGLLERSALDSSKFRPRPAGVEWYDKHRQRQEPPQRDDNGDSSQVEQVAKSSVSLRSLLEATDTKAASQSTTEESPSGSLTQRGQSRLVASPLNRPDPAERELLIGIIGSPQSESARLLVLMMQSNWSIDASALDAAFPGEFVDVIVDDINERANDSLGENLIFYEDEELVVNEDYCHDVETIISQSEYANLRHNSQ